MKLADEDGCGDEWTGVRAEEGGGRVGSTWTRKQDGGKGQEAGVRQVCSGVGTCRLACPCSSFLPSPGLDAASSRAENLMQMKNYN